MQKQSISEPYDGMPVHVFQIETYGFITRIIKGKEDKDHFDWAYLITCNDGKAVICMYDQFEVMH